MRELKEGDLVLFNLGSARGPYINDLFGGKLALIMKIYYNNGNTKIDDCALRFPNCQEIIAAPYEFELISECP